MGWVSPRYGEFLKYLDPGFSVLPVLGMTTVLFVFNQVTSERFC